MAFGVESGVHNDLHGRLYGADDRVRIYCVSAEISGDAVQCGKKSGQCVYRYCAFTEKFIK